MNFGRIIFQIIYHIHSYLELVRQNAIVMGEKVNLNVPSANFGNLLGGYYAQKMGLPVNKLISSSNENNLLMELINTGSYDLRGRKLQVTTSPAMDILKSSNIERVIFDLYGAERTRELMSDLDEKEVYTLTAEELTTLQSLFAADNCEGEAGKAYIKSVYENEGYLMDPHTATSFKAYENSKDDGIKTIIYSTAEWTKFSPTIAEALTGEAGAKDIDALQTIAKKANIEIPAMINGLFDKKITQDSVIEKEDIEKEILAFL